ncbi:MAG TPA: erythromycin esterase family protein [Allosphingosinicella sp.]|nr:erythromycin esterase family protein [Allosphingosinicella sp.]
MLRALLTIAVLLLAPAAAAQPPPGVTEAGVDRAALAAALRDLCGRDVALLGEADHGDGRTVAFKSALVRALVTRCGFNAVFFEASFYDFLEYRRQAQRGQAVSPDQIAAAIGGIWRYDEEMVPLIPFLWQRSLTGGLILGGLDDQLGSFGAFYANDAMPAELAGYLAGDRRAECGELLRRRIHSDFGRRYAAADRARIQTCLAEIRVAVGAGAADRATREQVLALLASFERAVGRDLTDFATYPRERDRSMYLNFRWLADRLPRRSRIIVWAATSHVAKDASATRDFAGGWNFGAYVHQAYGRRAFALGFSAYSGAHYWSRNEPNQALAVAPPEALEARALAGSGRDTLYLDAARLAQLGPLPGAAFMHQPATVRWNDVLDGLVVFRAERPTQRIGPAH